MQTELQKKPAAAVSEKSFAPIFIDLLHQQPNRIYAYRKYFAAAAVVLTACILVLLYLNFSWLNFGLSLLVALQGYNFLCSRRSPLWFMLGASYLALNEKGITHKQRKQKQLKVDWAEIDTLFVHLFTAELILKNDDTITIDLKELTDENLQLVKRRLQEVKQQWQI